MADYTLFFLDTDGRLIGADSPACSNDIEAITAGHLALSEARPVVEVWKTGRKMAHLDNSAGSSDLTETTSA